MTNESEGFSLSMNFSSQMNDCSPNENENYIDVNRSIGKDVQTMLGRVRTGRELAVFVVEPSRGNVLATSVSSSIDDIDTGFFPKRKKKVN